MSTTIGNYRSMDLGPGKDRMMVTAFSGGDIGRAGVQFTIGEKYCALRQHQVINLIKILVDRIGGTHEEVRNDSTEEDGT
ncbi:MAG: hypothetical protein WC683_04150 [bacterium]